VKSSRLARWTATAGVFAALVTGQVATAAPAIAAEPIRGLVRVSASSTLSPSSAPQTATALCPTGKVIVGGGGRAVETGTPTHTVRLTQLEPSDSIPTPAGTRQGYRVTAVRTNTSIFANWRVEAYAMCAFPISGRHIVVASTSTVTDPIQEREVRCPAGERVLGTGARINSPSTRSVALQVARSTPSGDLLRIRARESADVNWNLVGFAVCAPPPAGYQVKFGESPQRLSEQTKTAFAICDSGRRLIGSGGAIAATPTTPGTIGFEDLSPINDITMRAVAAEQSPTSQNWDFIVATGICANATA
jgi:hypothetical protein